MNARIITLGLLLAAAPLAQAGPGPIEQLARDTGLRPDDVRMLIGARTSHAQYRTTYNRKLAHFRQALGEEEYQRLMTTGRSSPLPYADANATASGRWVVQSSPAAGEAAGVATASRP